MLPEESFSVVVSVTFPSESVSFVYSVVPVTLPFLSVSVMVSSTEPSFFVTVTSVFFEPSE